MFQANAFQVNAFQIAGVAGFVVVEPTGSVEWPPKGKKRGRGIYEIPPTASQVQAERERLGILPAKVRQAVLKVVRESTNVSDETQAALLAAAYFEPVQLDRLGSRLQASFQERKADWAPETIAIAQALIFDALRRKSNEDLLAGMLADMRQEEEDAADLFVMMFLLDD